MTYYDFGDYHTLNTCSEEEKNNYIRQGFNLKNTTKIEIICINDLIHDYFPDGRLDFLSIDIEGQDEEIIKNIDYDFVRPAIICVETAVYKSGKIDNMLSLVEFLKSKGYYLTADTSLNSIFIDERRSKHKRFLNDIICNQSLIEETI